MNSLKTAPAAAVSSYGRVPRRSAAVSAHRKATNAPEVQSVTEADPFLFWAPAHSSRCVRETRTRPDSCSAANYPRSDHHSIISSAHDARPLI